MDRGENDRQDPVYADPAGFRVPGATTRVFLRILETGQTLPLSGRSEFTLGRASGNQPFPPDIDLTPFGGYEAGVSRQHATIQVSHGAIWVTDLGSANGTLVNGKKILAQSPVSLEPGDTLTLGNLKIQIEIE